MKLILVLLIFNLSLVFSQDVDYYDYNDDNDEYYQDKWKNHERYHSRHVKMTHEHFRVDPQERYFIFKNNLKDIEDHNQAYKNGDVTFSLKDNHFTHMTYEEFHDEFLTPLRIISPPIRAGSRRGGSNRSEHLHVKPIRASKHRHRFNNSKLTDRPKRDLDEEEIETEFVNSTHHHLVFHHTNKFNKSKYERVASKYKRFIQERNNGIFTLSARKQSNQRQDIVDWTARGFVTRVADQGSCGSCYAYATSGALESLIAIRSKNRRNLRELSKEQILDCANDGDTNAGCAGGNIYGTYEYIQKNGLQSEASYPYVSQSWEENETKIGFSGPCRFNQKRVISPKIKAINNIKTGDAEQMRQVLVNQPISAYIHVVDDLFQYHTGIYTNDQCSKDCSSPNHAVIITGHGVENGVAYWIVKNSWSESWGEKGYFRIEAGVNMCCIESFNSYVTI